MNGLTIAALLLYVLAVMRVTRLVNADTVTDPLRIAVMRHFGPESAAAYFIQCAWCVSMWVGLLTAPVLLKLVDLPLWWWPLLALAASHLTGLATRFDDEEMVVEIEDDL